MSTWDDIALVVQIWVILTLHCETESCHSVALKMFYFPLCPHFFFTAGRMLVAVWSATKAFNKMQRLTHSSSIGVSFPHTLINSFFCLLRITPVLGMRWYLYRRLCEEKEWGLLITNISKWWCLYLAEMGISNHFYYFSFIFLSYTFLPCKNPI